MTETPQGPGWWQAADHKWYPPERHPDHVAPAGPPGYNAAGGPQAAPQAWPAPGPQGQGAGGQVAADGLTTAKNIAARLSVTAWLLFAGFVIAVIATFFSLVSYNAGFLSVDSGFNGVQRLIVFVLVGVATWLAWPLVSGSQIAMNRLIGLSVVDGLFGILLIIWFSQVSSVNRQMDGIVDVSPGFGLMMCGAAIVLIAVGVVRLWIQRSQAQPRV